MDRWKNRAIELRQINTSWRKTGQLIQNEFFPDDDIDKVVNRVRAFVRRHDAASEPVVSSEDILTSIMKNGCTLEDIQHKFGISHKIALTMIESLSERGYCIEQSNGIYLLRKTIVDHEAQTFNQEWNGDKYIRFGIVSDNHFGSKWAQITFLHRAYDTFKAEGIPFVYNSGDLSEGEKMRPGHEYECYVHGFDEHLDEIVSKYPKRDGITTEFICGNHDASFIKHVGADIGVRIAKERPDMKYLGMDSASINLTPNCKMELAHPGGGSSYAISYRSQKTIDSIEGGKKPNILVLGHFHKFETLFYRNIHCLQAATTQAQSGFMKRNALYAAVGFIIVEVMVDSDGQINRFKPEFFPAYETIQDDWKNWK